MTATDTPTTLLTFERMYGRLVEAARDLLEPSELGKNPEYERGMVELIMDATGRTQDDKEEIYADIVEPLRDTFDAEARLEAAQMWIERYPCFLADPAVGGHCGKCLSCVTWYAIAHPESTTRQKMEL